MQDVSQLYLDIIADNHWFECKLVIAGTQTYGESALYEMRTSHSLFSGNNPSVGCCVAGEIDVVLKDPSVTIPRMALLEPYVRACNASYQSEWIPKGKYYIDERKSENAGGLLTLKIHGFDAMLKAEAPFPLDAFAEYPITDEEAVTAIASQIGVTVDDPSAAYGGS